MASKINFLDVDETYPVAGQDNDSQGFRDNFTVIKSSLSTAKVEIEDLQANTIKTNEDNNFAGSKIINANLVNVTSNAFFGSEIVTQDLDVKFTDGLFQLFSIGSDVDLALFDWPEEGRYGKMRLGLYNEQGDSTQLKVTFTNPTGVILYNKAFPKEVILPNDASERYIDFWSYDGGKNVYASYIGEFDQLAYGEDNVTVITGFDPANTININKDTAFLSDELVAKRYNGEIINLTLHSSTLIYKVNKVRVVDNVVEVYDDILINGLSPISNITNTNLTIGRYRFAISQSNVNTLLTTYSYASIKENDSYYAGLCYRVLLSEYVPGGQIVAQEVLTSPLPNQTFYKVTVSGPINLYVGARVKTNLHHMSLDTYIGTITAIDAALSQYTIEYSFDFAYVGSGGDIARENTELLVKGRIV